MKSLLVNFYFFSILIIISFLCFSCADANVANKNEAYSFKQHDLIIPRNSLNNKTITISSQKPAILATKNSQKNITVLYEQNVGNLSDEQVNQVWTSNNPRSWIKTGIMDGEISKTYKIWQNRYSSQVIGTADERCLENDTDLTIYIKNLAINTSDYQDIRLFIDYLTSSNYTSLTHTYSMELYVIDTDSNRHGPFSIANFETIGFFAEKNGITDVFKRNFNLITENLKIPNNAIIKELEIKPYANYPRIKGAELGTARDSRHADNTTFEIAGMKIVGYKNSIYTGPDYIKLKKINVDATREKIVKRMYDTATIKWSPSNDFHPLRSTSTNFNITKTTYQKGETYYGIPYTQRNKVPIEKFAHEIKNGVLPIPKDQSQIWGVDCAGSVSYSISRFIPMHVIYNSEDFIWERNKTSLLGKLKIDGRESSTEILKSKYSEQEIYMVYAKLQKGDIIATHYDKSSHVMLITGNSTIVRNDMGKINPDKSYFLRTDIKIGQVDTINSADNYGGQITPNDITVPFEPKGYYTNINSFGELKNKKLNFYINKKMTFKEAYNKNYVPITLNAYKTSTVEEPYARIINANTVKNIKDGIKGTIVSNYTILSVHFDVKNRSTGIHKTFIDYPNHNIGTLEGKYGNTYSLFYNTPQYIKNSLQKMIRKNDNFEIKISVTAGENDKMVVLSIKS